MDKPTDIKGLLSVLPLVVLAAFAFGLAIAAFLVPILLIGNWLLQ